MCVHVHVSYMARPPPDAGLLLPVEAGFRRLLRRRRQRRLLCRYEVPDNLVMAQFLSVRLRALALAMNHPITCSDWWGPIALEALKAEGTSKRHYHTSTTASFYRPPPPQLAPALLCFSPHLVSSSPLLSVSSAPSTLQGCRMRSGTWRCCRNTGRRSGCRSTSTDSAQRLAPPLLTKRKS